MMKRSVQLKTLAKTQKKFVIIYLFLPRLLFLQFPFFPLKNTSSPLKNRKAQLAASFLKRQQLILSYVQEDVLPGYSQCLRLKANNNKLTTSLSLFLFHLSSFFSCRENCVRAAAQLFVSERRQQFRKAIAYAAPVCNSSSSQTYKFLGHAFVLIRGERIITPA